jgi:3-hydroxymyristoyl/3-hydroxydecanoyl-(acyl carrier protein) dehydratase
MSEHILPLTVAADHPAYAGHFPGQPILPGVVLLDEALHALAVQLDRADAAWQLKSVKFHSPVQPGEQLVLHAVESPAGGFRFELRCRDARGHARVVASGSVVFSEAVAA